MCLNCGCGEAADDRGKPENITIEDLRAAAAANGQTLHESAQHIRETVASFETQSPVASSGTGIRGSGSQPVTSRPLPRDPALPRPSPDGRGRSSVRGIRKTRRPRPIRAAIPSHASLRRRDMGSEVRMDESLLQLMEELVASIEQRDAGDPDAPAWEAQRRIQRLEEELARRVRTESGRRSGRVTLSDEALVGIV